MSGGLWPISVRTSPVMFPSAIAAIVHATHVSLEIVSNMAPMWCDVAALLATLLLAGGAGVCVLYCCSI